MTRTTSSDHYYIVRAKGTATCGPETGQEIDITWGFYYGMGGYSQPAWEEGLMGRAFNHLEDALEIKAKMVHGEAYGFNVIPGTGKVIAVTTKVVRYHTEREITDE